MFFGKDNLFTYYDFYYDVRLIQKMKNLLRLDSPRSLFLHCVFFPSYPPNFISHYFRTGTKSRTGMTLFFYIHILHVFLIIEDLKWRFFFLCGYTYTRTTTIILIITIIMIISRILRHSHMIIGARAPEENRCILCDKLTFHLLPLSGRQVVLQCMRPQSYLWSGCLLRSVCKISRGSPIIMKDTVTISTDHWSN